MIRTKGATDQSVAVRVIDSTDGTPETGVAYNTTGIDLWYRREGGAVVSLTEATLATADAAHTDGGFIHISDGYCRLDLPDAAFASGADYVEYGGTITDMIVIGGVVDLVDVNLRDSVRAGLTALPNAAADAAGGLPISDAGGLDLDALLTTAVTVDGSITVLQLLRLLLADMYTGDGGGTDTVRHFAQDGTTPRITKTVDALGNRSAVTLDGS